MNFPKLRKSTQRMDQDDCWDILSDRKTDYGFLGTHGISEQNPFPYVVPINFAVDIPEQAIYFHTTIDEDSRHNASIKENPAVTFTVVAPDSKIRFSTAESMACKATMDFRSVIIFGIAVEVTDKEEKKRILLLMFEQKVMADCEMEIDELILSITKVYKIDILNIQGSWKK